MQLYHISAKSDYFKISELCPFELLDKRLIEIKTHYDILHKMIKTKKAKLNIKHTIHNPEMF